MTDASKYPHQSATWVLFVIFVLLFLSGVYYYFQGAACYSNLILHPHWGSTVSVSPCGNDKDTGALLLAISILPISLFGVCLIPKDRVKCPKCGYEFEGDI